MKFKSGILQKFDHLTEILKECQKKVSEMVTSEHVALLKQMQENRNCLQHHLETVTEYNRTAEGLMSLADDIVFLEVGKKICGLCALGECCCHCSLNTISLPKCTIGITVSKARNFRGFQFVWFFLFCTCIWNAESML